MYFKTASRINPETGKFDIYYRLVESYRNADNRICNRTLVSVGFLPDISDDQLVKIQTCLNDLYKKRRNLFSDEDERVKEMVAHLWHRLIKEKRIDLMMEEEEKMVKVDSLRHSNVREVGSESLCYETWNKLGLSSFLREQGRCNSTPRAANRIA